MTDTTPAFSGEVMLLDWSETAKGGAKIVLQLDGPDALEPFRTMTLAKRGIAGQRLIVVMVEVGDDESSVPSPKPEDKTPKPATEWDKDQLADGPRETPPISDAVRPFGKQASELYRNGFFYVPAVLEAIGTDAEFLDWIRAQPCSVTNAFDRHTDEATGIVTERCDAAHVRRVAAGAGTGIKPPYSAIPLLHAWHDAQTNHGESVFAVTQDGRFGADTTGAEAAAMGKEWMEKKRNEYVVEWASTKLAKRFNKPSMGFVDPADIVEWAHKYALEQYLPTSYRGLMKKIDLSQTWK